VLGARLLLQTAIEAEVTAFLGRERYERTASCEDARAGMRNGYCPTTVKTTAGPLTLARPKVRGTTERFASQLFGNGVTNTNALESLVIAGFVRGLSTRDVEATLVEALGEAAAVSKSTVSRVCEEITGTAQPGCCHLSNTKNRGHPTGGRITETTTCSGEAQCAVWPACVLAQVTHLGGQRDELFEHRNLGGELFGGAGCGGGVDNVVFELFGFGAVEFVVVVVVDSAHRLQRRENRAVPHGVAGGLQLGAATLQRAQDGVRVLEASRPRSTVNAHPPCDAVANPRARRRDSPRAHVVGDGLIPLMFWR